MQRENIQKLQTCYYILLVRDKNCCGRGKCWGMVIHLQVGGVEHRDINNSQVVILFSSIKKLLSSFQIFSSFSVKLSMRLHQKS